MTKSRATADQSPEGRRLLQLVNQNRRDSLLIGFLHMFTGQTMNADLPLGLIVGGSVLRGRLATPEEFARNLEASLASLIQKATFNIAGEPAQQGEANRAEKARRAWLSVLEEKPFSKPVTDDRQRDEKTVAALTEWEKGGTTFEDLDDLPPGLAKEVIDYLAPLAAFALTRAEILVGNAWTPIGTIRVQTREVAAWWLIPPE